MQIIRFSRIGKKGHAQYRVVLTEQTYPVQGKFTEVLGSYDPHQKKAVLHTDRINHWLGKGVQCSDSAYNLLVREGIVTGAKRKVKVPAKPQPEASAESPEAAPAKDASAAQGASTAGTKAGETAEAPVEAIPGEPKAE